MPANSLNLFDRTSTFVFWVIVLFAGGSPLLVGPATHAQETKQEVPGAPHLLPIDTLGYIRFDRFDDLREDWPSTSMGQMLADPAMRPFASDFYQTLSELFQMVGGRLEITLEELLAIPEGQVAAAVVPGNLSPEQVEMIAKDKKAKDESPEAIRKRLARKRKNQNALAGWFLIDAGDELETLMGLIEKLEDSLREQGYVRRVWQIGDHQLIRWLPPRPGRPEIEYFSRDQTVVLGIGHDTAAQSLRRWDQPNVDRTLAKNADFGALMSRCLGAEDTRPQMTFFIDPYHLIGRLVKRGGAAGFVWPIVENLGLAKIRGVGGSVFQGGETFESISHLHVLIDTPRDGFFGVLRPEEGEAMPPAWVPQDVTSYTSIHWDFENSYENFGKILEKFRGKEILRRSFEDPLAKHTEIDIRQEISETLAGRYVTCRWIEPPIRLNSQTQLHALEVNDSAHVKEIFAKLRKRYPNRLQVDSFGGNVIYQLPARGKLPDAFRKPEPSFVVLGNWLIFTDSRQFIEKVLLANNQSQPRLTNDLKFELVVSELGGKLDGEKPFLVSFLRGADYIQQIYDLIGSDDTSRFLKKRGEKNPFAKKMLEMLGRNELPDFKQFRKYFAPSGTFAYNEPTGMHLGSFTLRAEPNQ